VTRWGEPQFQWLPICAVKKHEERFIVEKLTLSVEGMSCGHCEIAIQDAVRKLPGIKKVKASKRKSEVMTEYDSDTVSSAQIITAVNGTGYRIIS
jgi:copper chaperone